MKKLPVFTKYICIECGHHFKRKGEHAYLVCPRCDGDAWWEGSSKFSGSFNTAVNIPAKGSPEWYRGKWFRRSQKEWEADIRSRVTSPDGKVVRRDGTNN